MAAILCVDDSKLTLLTTVRLLRSVFPDHEVLSAGSGEEALEVLEKHLDASAEALLLALMDYNMPGMDGLELASRVAERCPGAARLMCTANVQQRLEQRAQEQGVPVLHKPLSEAALRSRLSESGLL